MKVLIIYKMAAPAPAPVAPVKQSGTRGRGFVKMVLSGDSIIIRGQPKGGPPPEKQISLSNIQAPRMARRANPNIEGSVDTRDEAWAWAARENLRKKIIGKEVYFVVDYAPPGSERCYGTVYLGTTSEGENLIEMQVMEGLCDVRRVRVESEAQTRLIELEDQAKTAGKGKWGTPTPEEAIRDVTWTVDNARTFVDSFKGEALPAVVEQVRDGSFMKVSLTNTHHQVQIILSGIKCPMIRRDPEDPKKEIYEQYAAEAKFFVESRLLQRDVKVILEGVSNTNLFLGTVLHPNGNITELLLKEGFGRCVDWSITSYSLGPEKLRALEKDAKSRKARIWKSYESKVQVIKNKNFTGKVIQIIYADSIALKLEDGSVKTIHLSSIRPPKNDDVVWKPAKGTPEAEVKPKGGKGRSLYEIPYMFDAREFLRKKLIGKKVQVSVDYIKPASDGEGGGAGFSERTCATITSGGVNIAEALVSKGLVKVVRHRQDDDNRSASYDDLLSAEQRASKTGKGLYSKKEPATRHVSEVNGEQSKQLLPFLQRAKRFEAVVEYVFSGSRLKLYLPRESRLITFLLGGIDCPRGARNTPQAGLVSADPFADEAQALTKELVMHREVMVEVETLDRAGSFIGYLFIDGANLSEKLVDQGLSKLHFTADRSCYFKQLQSSEEAAKEKRLNMWAKYEEPKEVVVVEEPTERKANFRSVFVTEVTPNLHVFCQYAEKTEKLEKMMDEMRAYLVAEPPLPGTFTPRRNMFCVALFADDQLHYRAKVDKVEGDFVNVTFVDYGNKSRIPISDASALPAEFSVSVLPPQAHEFALALVKAPEDNEDLAVAFESLCMQLGSSQFLVNTEYRADNVDHVTLVNKEDKNDVGKTLIADGVCTIAKRNEKRLGKLQSDYNKEQEKARAQHLNLWQYGDISADDASEFGYRQ